MTSRSAKKTARSTKKTAQAQPAKRPHRRLEYTRDPVPPEFHSFSAAHVAGALGLSLATIHRRLKHGDIPSFKVGRLRRIPASWIKKNHTNP